MYNFINFHPKGNNNPTHIGIIPDGTRRWAKINCFELYNAYEMAMYKLKELVELFISENIEVISLYFSSEQNFKRNLSEIEAFCRAETYFIEKLLPKLVREKNIKVVVVGHIEEVPSYLKKSLQKISKVSESNSKFQLNLLVNYNPFEELQFALKKSDNVEDFLNHLVVKEPLDLVIRTSDANLLSNFLLLQSGYARFYNINKLFNETRVNDFQQIINEFRLLNRRYGE